MAALPRRHPWLVASLAAHVALAASLYTAGPVRIAVKRDQGVRRQVQHSLQQTAQREMQRELRTMDEIRDALAKSAGEAGAAGDGGKGAAKDSAGARDPAAQARALAAQIEAVRQKIRAAEMARLLRIPEAEALKRVKAETARQPRPALPKNRPPEAVVAEAMAQAKAALAERRAQLLAQGQGVPVKRDGGARLNPGRPGTGAKAAGAGTPGAGPQGGNANGRGLGKGSGGGAGVSGDPSASSALGGRLDALAQGLEMGTPGALTGSSLDMSSSAFGDSRGYGDYLAPPPVDADRTRIGNGRMLGAGGAYANRVFLDTWYMIGPFDGQGRDSQTAIYPPERGIDLDAVYYGKNHLPVRWTFQQDARYPSVPLPRAENAVYYAYTEVEVDRDMDVWVSIGADDDSKMWFNDRLVWISSLVDDKPWYRQPFYTIGPALATRNLTEGQRRLHFHQGRNTILFKLYNGMNLMFFSVVLSK
jgi:hypothetical protein